MSAPAVTINGKTHHREACPIDYRPLAKALATISPSDPIQEVGQAPLSLLPVEPEMVLNLADDKLYCFPYDRVPRCWLRCYEEAQLWCIVKSCQEFESLEKKENRDVEVVYDEKSAQFSKKGEARELLEKVVNGLDMAVIKGGAPGRREEIERIFEHLYRYLHAGEEDGPFDGRTAYEHDHDEAIPEKHPPFKKRRLSSPSSTSSPSQPKTPLRIRATSTIPSKFPTTTHSRTPKITKPLTRMPAPSLEAFTLHVHRSRTPLILTDAISHWPALHPARWPNPRYWMRRTLDGLRLVPVELGRSYTDEGWGQRLMPFGAFMREHLLRDNSQRHHSNAGEADVGAEKETKKEKENRRTGYLAQHDLLSQIPALHRDIGIPEYCYVDPPPPPVSTTTENPDAFAKDDAGDKVEDAAAPPMLNVWLGPAHTISPAHTDPHHNLLAQVLGRKYVRLYAPEEGERRLYPRGRGGGGGGVDMGNTSGVDVGLGVEWVGEGGHGMADGMVDGMADETEIEKRREHERLVEQRERFPLFESAEYVEGVLGPGECLYIPRGWWHYVRSLDVSASVSFWWD